MMLLNENLPWKMEDTKGGSESLRIPTPLDTAPCLCHISASDNVSFGPAQP